MALTPIDSPPITVVISLTDHRGRTEAAVSAWNRQTYPRELITLYLLYDGRRPAFADELPPLLEDHDRLRCEPGLSEIELYDLGLRDAETPWLFICEPHVEPQPDALAEMVYYLQESGAEVVACNSAGHPANNFVGKLEDHVFKHDLLTKGIPDHWNKIILRGCCLQKSAYLDSGGLQAEYSHFSEPLLGAELKEKGYKSGFADKSLCLHHGTSTLGFIQQNLTDYGQDEMKCCLQIDPAFEAKYFGLLAGMQNYSRLPVGQALKTLSLLSGTGQSFRERLPVYRFIFRQMFSAPRQLAAIDRLYLPWLKLLLQLRRFFRVPAEKPFFEFWNQCIRTGRNRYLVKHPSAMKSTGHAEQSISAEQLNPNNSLGFHPLEPGPVGGFRWTCGAACLSLPLATGRWDIALELGTFRVKREGEIILLKIAGQQQVIDPGKLAETRLTVEIDKTENSGSATPLYILSTNYSPASDGQPDERTLGIVFRSVKWQKI